MIKKIGLTLLVTALCVIWIIPVSADSSGRLSVQSSCGAERVQISEVNYVASAEDEAEFIELRADGTAALDTLEIHLIDQNGEIYKIYALKNYDTSDLGYFVLKGMGGMATVNDAENNEILSVTKRDLIDDGSPGGIGLYGIDEGDYCNFVNYGGAVVGREAYLNIGIDSVTDGEDRACSQSSWGWWSCANIATPASSNETVAIAMQEMVVFDADMFWVTAALALSLALLTATATAVHKPSFANN